MEVLDRRIAGTIILLLWAMLVFVKRRATGTLLGDRPSGGAGLWLVHLFNFSFLLVANPLAAAVLMIPGAKPHSEPAFAPQWYAGLYAAGCMLLAWALLTLRRNYQVGGNPPRASDEFVRRGPYRALRHPMYTAAVAVSLGLAFLTRHGAYYCVFFAYFGLVFFLIPVEERGLRRAYGKKYEEYRQSVKRVVPFLY